MQHQADRIIETQTAQTRRAALGAAIDAQQRSKQALKSHADFFLDPMHQSKLDAVEDIVNGFFKAHNGIYRNHRENGGKPFSTIKVDRPSFPMMSQQRKKDLYLDPLRAMGVEIVFSKQSNSYIYRVR
jgi:hypothetical protein